MSIFETSIAVAFGIIIATFGLPIAILALMFIFVIIITIAFFTL